MTRRDWWGERSFAVLGDSISFGAGCTDPLAEHSYVGIVKQAVKPQNYGFTSAYPTSWRMKDGDHAHEVHLWPYRSQTDGEFDWICDNNDVPDRLISVGQTARKAGATLCFSLRETVSFDYFCVYYHAEPGGGAFSVCNGTDGTAVCAAMDDTAVYVTDSAVRQPKRTAFYRMADVPNGLGIVVASDTDGPVTITGIGYYNDLSDGALTFNNYSRGGIKLSDLSDTVLSIAASSETLLVGLGYNDAYYGEVCGFTLDMFTDRVDYLIREVNKNGTKLIVNNYAWDDPQAVLTEDQKRRFAHCRRELRRLADETDGVYLDQTAIHGEAILKEVHSGDGVHPTDAGHALIAKAVLQALGL